MGSTFIILLTINIFSPTFENYLSSIDHEIYQNLSLNAGCLLIGEKHTQQEEGKYYIPLQW